jgi:putative DNA primase/helicase
VNKELQQNNIDLKEPEDVNREVQGSNSPFTTSSGSSASVESPFETIENTRLIMANFVGESPTWVMTLVFNGMQKPPLPENELKEMFDKALILKEETAPKLKTEEIIDIFKTNKTEGTFLLAQHIVSKYNIITIGEKEREMFVYRDGMYYAGAENLIIYPEIQKILGSLVNKNAKTETFHKICDATAEMRSIFTLTPPRYIPLKNGVYDFETGELLSHSSDYRFKYQMPIVYDSTAVCPKTEAFFDQILNPKQRTIIEEWIGYYFWRDYRFKKAMVFVGEGDTGKTTLLEVITFLIGRENIASISLQKMTSDKFSAAHMYEKHGNLVDELSAKDISDTDAFKMATGNGSVTGEYKFGNQFSFQNFAKLTYACNRIPDMADNNDDAYFNRWIITRFENTITKKIPNFIETLQTEEERSGLFNLAMHGLHRLFEQKQFTYNNNAEETKLEMMRSGSSVAMFASDMLEREDGAEVTKEAMYDAYVEYCKEKKVSTQTKDALGKRLSNYATFLSDGTMDGVNAKGRVDRVRCWRNGKIKGKVEAKQEEFDNW